MPIPATLALPRATNSKDGKAMVAGVAYKNSHIYVLDYVGPQALVKSVWASLTANEKAAGISIEGEDITAHRQKLARPAATLKFNLKGTQYQNWLSYHTPDPNGLVFITSYDALGLTSRERQSLFFRADIQQMAADRLVKGINRISKAVAVPEWGPALLRRVTMTDALDAITELTCWGNVLAAYLLSPTFKWEVLIGDMLKAGEIRIPEPPPITTRPNRADDYRLM